MLRALVSMFCVASAAFCGVKFALVCWCCRCIECLCWCVGRTFFGALFCLIFLDYGGSTNCGSCFIKLLIFNLSDECVEFSNQLRCILLVSFRRGVAELVCECSDDAVLFVGFAVGYCCTALRSFAALTLVSMICSWTQSASPAAVAVESVAVICVIKTSMSFTRYWVNV